MTEMVNWPSKELLSFIVNFQPFFVNFSNLLQKSFPLKLLGQINPNLSTIIFGVSSLKDMSADPDYQPRRPPWLKIEHRGKMQFLAYNSKTKAFRANPTGVKLFISSRSICPEIFRWIGQPVVGLLALN